MKRFLIAALACAVFAGCRPDPAPRVLVFSKTEGYRHASIEAGQTLFRQMAATHGFDVSFTEDARAFDPDTLARYQAVVFLNTTGDVLTQPQQAHFQRFIQAGGGYVGIHAAADTEYGWSWYGRLAGAYFAGHPNNPNVREATLAVTEAGHPATEALPATWTRTDEWYDFRDPNPDVTVLLTVDEHTYKTPDENPSDAPHPVAWYHAFDGGRAFYTALGHTAETYADSLFQAHLWGGLDYVLSDRRPVDYARATATPESDRFSRVVLEDNLFEPMELDVIGPGRVVFVERHGGVFVYDEARGSAAPAGTLDVFNGFEEGLLGVAADPDFARTRWLYFTYSHPERPVIQVGRFTLTGADTLDRASERVLLEIPVQRDECCHVGGSVEFGPSGDLYVSVGDNTNPFASDGYAPIDERPGRAPWDAQKSSANTQDLRGKILRITPQPDGTYTIPEGNLFADAAEGRPEIYVMGNRNPFRISIDADTGDLYWGEVGPDAGQGAEGRGPRGYDEINRARSAGFFGWPYFIADNKPYRDFDFATGTPGPPFDAANPRNTSPHNTGADRLPPPQGAFIWYPYDASETFAEVGTGSRNAMAGPLYHADRYGASPRSLPAYYDGRLFIYDWARSWIKTVSMDAEGRYRYMEPFMPDVAWSRPMDMALGADGTLYVLEYGANWFARNADARLSRIDFNAGNRPPQVRIAQAQEGTVAGAAPFTVTLTAEATDPDRDPVTYAWDMGDGMRLRGTSVTHTYAARGTYRARVEARDAEGAVAAKAVTVEVGNAPPEVTLTLRPNASFYWADVPLDYRVGVVDPEDGEVGQGIAAHDVTLTVAYLAEGLDETEVQRGHQGLTVRTEGMRRIEEANCQACHQIADSSVGPSYRRIAARYAGQNVEDRLVQKIIQGGSGAWGDHAMAAHPHLAPDEVEVMVRYILGLADTSSTRRLATTGRFMPRERDGATAQGRYLFTAAYTDRGAPGGRPQTRRAAAILRAPRVEAEALLTPTVRERRRDYGDEYGTGGPLSAVVGIAGEHLVLPQVDLGGIREATVQIVRPAGASWAGDGLIEVRLDQPDGPLVGAFEIRLPPGDGSRVHRLRTRLAGVPGGFHDVYLVFAGARPSVQVVELDWIAFEPPAR